MLSDFAHTAGGAQKVCLMEARALATRGVRVHLFSAIGPVDEEVAATPGVTVRCLDHVPYSKEAKKLRAFRRIFWNGEARAALAEVLRPLDPATTLVHVHLYHMLLTSSTLDLALDRGFPTVLTLHDYGIACPVHSFYINPEQRICRLRPLSPACWRTNCTTRGRGTKLALNLRAVVEQRFARLPERISAYISVSRFSHDVLRPYLPEQTPVHFVMNPTEIERRPRVECERNPGAIFVGRLTSEKAPELLAEAARLARYPATFVGDGERTDAVMGANPDAHVTGWVTADEVDAHVRSARALAVTSRWYEAAPLVVFEALAFGIPVLVPDTCAAREFIVDGETGMIFRSGDAADLARCLEALRDDDRLRAMSEAAYARFWTNPPTLDAHVDRLLDEVYGEVLEAKRATKRAS